MPRCAQMVFEAKVSIYYSIQAPFQAVLSDFQVNHKRFAIKFRYYFVLYTTVWVKRFYLQKKNKKNKKKIVFKCRLLKSQVTVAWQNVYLHVFSNLHNHSHKTLFSDVLKK